MSLEKEIITHTINPMSKNKKKIRPETVDSITVEIPAEALQITQPEILGMFVSYLILLELDKTNDEIVEIQNALYGEYTCDFLRNKLVDLGFAHYEGEEDENED